MSERIFERASHRYGALRSLVRQARTPDVVLHGSMVRRMRERVFERASHRYGALRSLVHQARTPDVVLHGSMVRRMSERVFDRVNQQHGLLAHGRAPVALLPDVTPHGEVLT